MGKHVLPYLAFCASTIDQSYTYADNQSAKDLVSNFMFGRDDVAQLDLGISGLTWYALDKINKNFNHV